MAAGDSLTVAGSGFFANSAVSLDLHSDTAHLASLTTDGNGGFQATVTIPESTAAGSHEMTATGQDPGGTRVLSAELTVTQATLQSAVSSHSSSGGLLPHTGADIIGFVVIGLALISGGFVLVRSARRRRATAS